MRDAEREGAVRTRSNSQPDIRLVRGAGAAGIDHDQTRASIERLRGRDRVRDPGKVRVVAPEQDAAGLLEVRHVHAGNTGAMTYGPPLV